LIFGDARQSFCQVILSILALVYLITATLFESWYLLPLAMMLGIAADFLQYSRTLTTR